jgi:5'-nucleotidase
VPEIDFILGGHDHVFINEQDRESIIIKSGTDFRELTLNKVKLYKRNSVDVSLLKNEKISEHKFKYYLVKGDVVIGLESELLEVVKALPEDEYVAKVVHEFEMKTEETFKQVIGFLHKPVDAKFATIRSSSTSISNFMADLMRLFMNTDMCLINTGSLRMDSTINEGEVT